MASSCFILADYDCGRASHSSELSRARTQRLVREASPFGFVRSDQVLRLGQGLRIKRLLSNFSVLVKCPWQESNLEPVGFRHGVKGVGLKVTRGDLPF